MGLATPSCFEMRRNAALLNMGETIFTHLRSWRGSLPQLCWGRWREAPDGVRPAASMEVGLHDRHGEPASIETCFPHPIRPFRPPSPLRGEGGDSPAAPASRPLHHTSHGPPPPLSRVRISEIVLAARSFAPELCCTARKRASKQIKGRRSAERRGGRYRGPADQRCRSSLRSSRRALLLGTRSPSGALPRLSPNLAKTSRPWLSWLSPVPRFMVADNRSAPRAASSWRTCVVAGRASFRTASRTRLRTPSRAPLPLHQSAVTG
jgi:hypothetical protein